MCVTTGLQDHANPLVLTYLSLFRCLLSYLACALVVLRLIRERDKSKSSKLIFKAQQQTDHSTGPKPSKSTPSQLFKCVSCIDLVARAVLLGHSTTLNNKRTSLTHKSFIAVHKQHISRCTRNTQDQSTNTTVSTHFVLCTHKSPMEAVEDGTSLE